MNPYALISLATSFITFTIGIISYQNESEHSINRIFAFLCFSFVLYSFSEFGYLQAESYERAEFWMTLSSVWAVPVAISLHFSLLYTGKLEKSKKIILLYSYISASAIIFLNLTTDFISSRPVKKSYGWTYTLPENKLFFFLAILWALSIVGTGTILIFLHYYQLKDSKSKKKALLILIGFLIPVIIISFFNLLSIIICINLPKLYSLSLLGSSFFNGYAIYKYRIFSFKKPIAIKSILEEISEILILIDNDGIIVEVNSTTERLLGYSKEILKGRNLKTLFTGRDWQKLSSCDNNDTLFDMINVSGTEFTLKRKESNSLPVLLSVTRITGPEVKTEGYILIGENLTDQKEAAKQINKWKGRFRALFEYTQDSIFINDINGKLIDLNRAAVATSGYRKEELIGKNIFKTSLIPADQMSAIFKLIKKYKNGKPTIPFKIVLNRKDGGKKHLEISTFPLNEGNREIIIIVRNITIPRQIEAKLRTSEENYRTVIDNIDEGIANVDRNGTFTFVNSAAENIFGVPPGGLIGQKLEKFIDSKNFHIIRKQIENRKHGLPGKYEIEIIHPAKSKRFIYVTANPKLNSDGSFSGSFGVFRDITEQKRAVKDISKALKEKDILLNEIHHRVKNNLQIIASLLNMQSRCIKDEEASKQIKESRDRVFSMSLIHEILYQSGKNAFVDINEYIINLATNLFISYSINEKRVDLKININKVYLNINQAIPCGLILNELISNSLKHAFKADREGTIRIKLNIDSTKQVTFIYSDNGTSFPKEFDIKSSKTLGLRLINTLVRQLDATLNLNTSNNNSFIIKFSKQKINNEIKV